MRDGWTQYKMGELVSLKQGFALNKKSDHHISEVKTAYPLLKISDLLNNIESLYVKDTIPKQFLVKPSEIIYSRTGQVGYAFMGRRGVIYNNCFKVTPNHLIDNTFLLHLLNSQPVRELARVLATGTAQPDLNHGAFKSIKVTIPPLPTQQKIASILSAYDDLIEHNTKRIELLEEQAQLIYEEWFVRMKFPDHENTKVDAETGLPNGWTNTTLAVIAKINANSISSSFDKDIQYIDISSVSTKSVDHTTKYPIKEAPGRAKRIVTHGDIIWSCVRPNRKSYAVIWNPKENTIASTGFTVISPTEVSTSFLYQVLGTEQFIAYLTNRATGAAYPAVKSIDFKEYDISLPPKSLIDKFDAQTKDYLDVIWNLKQQNEKLKEAKDILLPRLMMGIIEV